MRQKRRHPQCRIARHNAQHGGKVGFQPVLAIDDLGQFFSGFIPECIADNDKQSVPGRPLDGGLNGLIKKVVLVGDAGNPPFFHQIVRMVRCQKIAPFQRQLHHEPVAVAIFDLIPKRFQYIPTGLIRRVGKLMKFSVPLIEQKQLPRVGGEHRFRRRIRKPRIVFLSQGKQIDGGQHGMINGSIQVSRRIFRQRCRCPVSIQPVLDRLPNFRIPVFGVGDESIADAADDPALHGLEGHDLIHCGDVHGGQEFIDLQSASGKP